MNNPADAGLALLALGAAHGVNPAMGWLFAVGRGLQLRSRRAVWTALGPLALGHAMAIAAAVAVATMLGEVIPPRILRWIVAAALFSVGVDGLVRHRHVRLGGMRVGPRELTSWSFLMASAHGAGLMVLPFMIGPTMPLPGSASHHHMMSMGGGSVDAALTGGMTSMIAPLIHTAGYLAVTALLAVVVYEKVGLRMLRRAWINLNVVWSVAMIAAGAVALLA